jgi:hypothetical protein
LPSEIGFPNFLHVNFILHSWQVKRIILGVLKVFPFLKRLNEWFFKGDSLGNRQELDENSQFNTLLGVETDVNHLILLVKLGMDDDWFGSIFLDLSVFLSWNHVLIWNVNLKIVAINSLTFLQVVDCYLAWRGLASARYLVGHGVVRDDADFLLLINKELGFLVFVWNKLTENCAHLFHFFVGFPQDRFAVKFGLSVIFFFSQNFYVLSVFEDVLVD